MDHRFHGDDIFRGDDEAVIASDDEEILRSAQDDEHAQDDEAAFFIGIGLKQPCSSSILYVSLLV